MSAGDWLDALRSLCDSSNQTRAAAVIGYSPTVVSQVLSGNYPGDLARVEQSVRGALLGATVPCPVLGDLRRDICLHHQERPFAATSPTRVQLYQQCPICTHRIRPKGGKQ